jgi:nicotinamide mononucleotide transporter
MNYSLCFNYLRDHWVEIVGAILSLIYLYLSIKEKVSLWFYGIVSSLFYIVIFFQTKFYADMSLQFYYVFISIYGWIIWVRGKQGAKAELPTTRMTKRQTVNLVIATGLIYILYYMLLSRYTDSTIPKTDSLVGALGIVGTWMLARKLIENWFVWIVADGLCVWLYVYKGLYPTAILYVIYTLMSVVGYFEWKKIMSPAKQTVPGD